MGFRGGWIGLRWGGMDIDGSGTGWVGNSMLWMIGMGSFWDMLAGVWLVLGWGFLAWS